jgi:N-acetylmuramoyl-L-alanine amidase
MAGNATAVAQMEEAAALMRDAGLTVTASSGWKDRGRSSSVDYWHITDHHTANPNDNDAILINGRPDLAGPLCNYALHEYGDVVLIASGRANHAGEATVSSSNSVGIEATGPQKDASGNWMTGPGAFPGNYDAYIVMNACILASLGLEDVSRIEGHYEICIPEGRKGDPYFSMPTMRTQVAEGGDMGLSSDDKNWLKGEFQRIYDHDGADTVAITRGEINGQINTSGQHFKDSNRATYENENAHFKYLARGEAPDGTTNKGGQHFRDSNRAIYELVSALAEALGVTPEQLAAILHERFGWPPPAVPEAESGRGRS